MEVAAKFQRALDASRLCLGLDPHVGSENVFLAKLIDTLGTQLALELWAKTAIDACEKKSAAVKFQSAFYEVFGTAGWEALRNSIAYAQSKNLFVIYDAKRGDIASTMEAYGKAAFDVLQADALTVHLHMGTDVVKSLLPWLKQGKIIYLVWKTSNASAAEFQNDIANKVQNIFEKFAFENNILPSLGYVLGVQNISKAFVEEKISRLDTKLILPGIGAQGAEINSHVKTFLASYPQALLPISRGITQMPTELSTLEDFADLCKIRINYFADMLI